MIWRLAFAVLALVGCGGAASGDDPKKPAYEVPTYDGKKDATKEQPKEELTLSPAPNARELFQMVLECWPAKSFFRGELNLETRITQRAVDSVNTAQTTFDPVSGQYVTQTGTGDKFVGLVFRIPLFSATELDREREREANRRAIVAKTVGEFVEALAEYEMTMRQLRLMKALEKRAQERVKLGVTDTTEQVGYLEKVATLDSKLYSHKAALIKTRVVLGGMCSDDKGWIIDEYLKRFKDIE